MRRFHLLENWNPKRDRARSVLAANVLDSNNIKYTCTSVGHYKIVSQKCYTLMFYPKSGKIVWKSHRGDIQHVFVNDDEGKLVSKIMELI